MSFEPQRWVCAQGVLVITPPELLRDAFRIASSSVGWVSCEPPRPCAYLRNLLGAAADEPSRLSIVGRRTRMIERPISELVFNIHRNEAAELVVQRLMDSVVPNVKTRLLETGPVSRLRSRIKLFEGVCAYLPNSVSLLFAE